MRKIIHFLWLYLMVSLTNSYGQITKSRIIDTDGAVHTIVQAGDTVYIGGTFSKVGYKTGCAAKLTTTSDVPDRNFPQISGSVYTAVSDENGGWYLGGSFNYIVGGQTRKHLAHVLPDGTFDPNFDPAPGSFVRRLLLSGSTLYVSGAFSEIGGKPRWALAALNSSTGQATNWAPQTSGEVNDMEISGSTLYVGGQFSRMGGQSRNNLAALDITSGLATDFAPQPNSAVYDMAIAGSTLYVGGLFTEIKGQNMAYLVALNTTNGQLIDWNPQPNQWVGELLVFGSTLYAAGPFTQIGGHNRSWLAAVDISTGRATSFNPEPNSGVNDLTLSGSTLYVGGQFTFIGGQKRKSAAALNLFTGQATSWSPETGGAVYEIASYGQELLVVGWFDFVQANARQNLAAYKASTGEILSWNPGANNKVEALVVSSSAVYAGGGFTQLGNQQRAYIGAVSKSAGTATTWNPSANNTVHALAVDGPVVYAGGDFTSIGGHSRPYLAALNINSHAVTLWNPSANNKVYALAVDGSAIYAGGSFSKIEEHERHHIAAFDKSSGSLTSWNPAANGNVFSLTLDGSLVYAGGAFSMIGGRSQSFIAALNTETGQAINWSPQLNATVTALTKAQGQVFAGGSFDGHFTVIDAATGSPLETFPQVNNQVHALHYNSASSTVIIGGEFTAVGEKSRGSLASFDVLPRNEVRDQAIIFNAIGDRMLIEDPLKLVATASSGLPVSFSVLSGPATVSADKLTFTGTGTVTVRASQAGNENYYPAKDVEQSFDVTKANQSISFAAIDNKILGDPGFELDATASSGLPVSLKVVSGPATLSGNEVVVSGSGAVLIEATQAGSEEYAPAMAVQRSFIVFVAQTITFPTIEERTYGDDPIMLDATSSSGLTVLYQILSGPATVTGNMLTITGPGNVTVRATQPGNSMYAPASPVEQSFTIQKGSEVASQVITFLDIPNTPPTLQPIPAYASASSGLPVRFTIKSGPATVDGNLITITGSRALIVVEASQEGDANYHAAEPVEQSFYVLPGPKENQYLMVAVRDMAYRTHPFPIMAEASSGLPVELEIVSGPATISGKYITLTGTGTVVVKASQAGSFYYESKSTERSFNVYKATQDLFFPLLPNSTFGDGPVVLETTASSGLPVTWEVVTGPATVSDNILTITGAGMLTIRATQEGNENYHAAEPWEYSFEVEKAPQTVSFAPVPAKALGDEPFMLSATASSGLPINFSLVSGPATVSGNTVTLTGVGTVVVRAQQEGDANYLAATPVEQRFDVSPTVLKPQSITFNRIPGMTIGDAPVTLTATASSGLPVYFEKVSGHATISGNKLTAITAGLVRVKAIQPGNDVYAPAPPVETSVWVEQIQQYISFAAIPDKTLGDLPFRLSGTTTSGRPVFFSVVSGPATITDYNLLTMTGVGTVVVKASQPGGIDYFAAPPVTQSFEVLAGPIATGGVLWQYLLNAPSSANLPSDGGMVQPFIPTGSRVLNSFATPRNFGQQYFSRARGYVVAPVSGNYVFMVAGDDRAELWLSTDEMPSNKRMIASVSRNTSQFQYDKYPSQTSAPVYLEAGQRYYIEALHREYRGVDHLSVGWMMPGGMVEQVISGQYLMPYEPDGLVWEYLMSPPAWADVPSGGGMVPEFEPTGTRMLNTFATPRNFAQQYFSRARGYVVAPMSGNYVFLLAGDDHAELWLSTDEMPSNKTMIAHVYSHTAQLQYDKYASQTSAPVYLEAGERYYIEALHREYRGVDHLSVGWMMPDGTVQQAILGQYLRPYKAETELLAGVVSEAGLVARSAKGESRTEVSEDPLQTYPNPFQRDLTVAFTLEQAEEQVVVEVFSLHGKRLDTLHNGKAEAGVTYSYTFNGDRHATGVYLCRMTYQGKSITKRIVLAK